ncbi:TPA: helix-turn-helix transcriptional regulator [Kluyvera cryocrescens]|uniref:Helix-turn-helix transcriptional regulator n=2 Tax=Enterobacteriaceae TaxID=543 RepID=A0AAW9CB59_KLUCR|nr:helix-turn-helix transcriptional regulator [Kluyvera cryocrescens]MCX2866029.1 helix-turn-helix transcriptional regulator [Kluyvera cryocrescens]MDU5686156.1 helix-turn-helix transcriptional regulator [Kluyvera cryocrescens]MDW3779138.1 helix-turn-helix transcriptional regulator [Kluyvera cryocrescens]MEB6632142.1 helix-turn-helix transcriptional regulator [Kluyvera cryocrescens]MEB7555877.1 helix-turn-helix transcriptional regulator [Kluyvera cryocrescens]
MMLGLSLDGYHPDSHQDAAVAFGIQVVEGEQYIPLHQHRKGQLILALHGAITCEVENALWMVPPQFAVWVPGEVPHSNRATPQAELCFLFIEPGAAKMPAHCCTLKISPLVRELILTLAQRDENARLMPETQRLIQVLFDELPQQPEQQLQLPVSTHPKIRLMVEMMEAEPAQWQTLSQWASRFAMSERNLARLVVKETGLNFRRWRHQLQLILALQMLVRGLNVQQVALSLGYDSTTAFITMFRKGLGQTPGRYLAELTTTSQ